MLTCLYDIVGYVLLGSLFMCLFPCHMVRSLSSHAYMLGFMFFHVYVLDFYMFRCMFLCLYVQIYVSTCLCAWIYVLYLFYTISHVLVCSMPCLCAQAQSLFVMPRAIVALLSLLCLFFVFWPIGLNLIQTLWYLSSFIHQGPHQRVWIIPILHVYACLLLCFILILASLDLGFATLDAFSGFMVMWLHPMPMRPCLDVTTWDASSDARLLRAYPSLFCFVRCYAYHTCLHHPLAFYAFLQAWLYVHA